MTSSPSTTVRSATGPPMTRGSRRGGGASSVLAARISASDHATITTQRTTASQMTTRAR
jgi:hypothetical protein